MAQLKIRGGRPLEGQVDVGGRKNSAVAVIPATLLADTPSVIENIPEIEDVQNYFAILRAMGVEIEQNKKGHWLIDPTGVTSLSPPASRVGRMRASYYLIGVLLARWGEAEVPLPGGCDIGMRPIDQHLKGLRALGAEVEVKHGTVKAKAASLEGTNVYLDVASVGATINLMLAASRAQGVTVIENAAKESHVVDLANFLNAIGVRVVGAGTDVIKIHGARELRGARHAIIPDEIEASTYILAIVASKGDALVNNVVPKHLEPVAAKLREAGAEVKELGDQVQVRSRLRLKAVNVKTLPYPGFPTDAQQPMTVVLSLAEGTSTITETIWPGRFKHVDELRRMGSRIKVEGSTAIIEGVEQIHGTHVRATDLRAGAALVIAGLAADGETVVSGMEHVARGYEHIRRKLNGLGARAEWIADPPEIGPGQISLSNRTGT